MDAKEQWELVAELRRELQRTDEERPWPGLESDWQRLGISGSPYLDRDNANLSDYVLPSIVTWLENIDAYPPPEMMLALHELFRQYMNAAGALTLEEVFFGKPKQRQGSYAARRSKFDVREIGFSLAFHGGKHKGMSDAQAAAYAQCEVEQKFNKTMDADTMLRKMRRARARTRNK